VKNVILKKILSGILLLAICLTLPGGLLACSPANIPEAPSDTESNSESNTTDQEESTLKDTTESTNEQDSSDETQSNEKTIDLYLIAGQSNATGCTQIKKFSDAYDWAPELKQGFSNVHYAGNSRSNGSEPRDRIIAWQKTTFGLGIDAAHFGPEAGMAKALSVYYNEESGKHAGMIKYAFGGSSLLNDTTGSTAKDGNWVSPTYQKTLPSSEVVPNVTGQMYRNFLAQVEKNVSELMEYGGYTSVRICGLYWMQGCANKSKPNEYELAFKCFAIDVRKDLSEIMKKYTGSDDDCGASKMPIIVGTISQTQNLTSASTESVNITFINMQKSFAKKIDNCYVVDNSAYPITAWENGTQVIKGSDRWHWNQADMLEIGKNVGDAMLYCAGITKTDPFPAS